MMRSRSLRAAGWIIGVAISLAGAAPGRAQPLPKEVRIAYQPLVAVPEGAMKQKRWLEDAAKVPVRWANFSSGADVNTAFAAGAVDIGLMGLPVFVSGLAQGIKYRLILLHDIPGTVDGLAVRNGAGVKTVQDLKGKRIGVPFGSGADYMLQGALKEHGLSPDDVTPVNLQPQPIVAAWTTGQIDAAYIWAPIVTKLLEADGTMLVSDGDMAKKGYFAGDVAVVADQFAERYPQLVQAFVEQNLRAAQWVNANGAGAHDAMMKEYELTPDQLAKGALPPATAFPGKAEQLSDTWMGGGAGGMVDSCLRIGQFLSAAKLIAQAPTRDQLSKGIDPSFVANAKAPD